MKILRLEDQIRSMVEERSFLISRAVPGEQVELEVRLGVKPNTTGTDKLAWTNSYEYARSIAQRKT